MLLTFNHPSPSQTQKNDQFFFLTMRFTDAGASIEGLKEFNVGSKEMLTRLESTETFC